ncbi:MAG: hypothetical protein CMM50_06120 [Rhodospirillaceae bacterium]|nr:hypothetical protein [Rhodospirillaceae bacterium]
MSSDKRTPLTVPAFFNSGEPIRPRSKIPRRAIPPLCLAFCWPMSVPLAAKVTGYSAKTVKALYFDLRELLLDPRYRKWHSFTLQSAYELDPVWETVIETVVWSCYARCYAARWCSRNFMYGKRSERECANCPILKSEPLTDVFDEKFREDWLRLVDRTRTFYLDTLKIRGEPGYEPDVFKRRVYHQQIVNTARVNSVIVNAQGEEVIDHLKEGSGTVRDLWSTMLQHIIEEGKF